MSPTTTLDPLTAWQRLCAGNDRFAMPVDGYSGDLIEERPTAAVFRCSDARLAGETVFGQSWGSLIDVSTWGHVIDSGVLATLEYAIGRRDVPLIVVLGHQDCHAMRAAMRAWNEADMPADATRATVEQAITSMVRRGTQADSLESVSSAHLVETGLALLERSPVIARRVDAGQCAIVCATAGPGAGRLRVYATIGAVGEVNDSLLECL